jgi:hypothetical protein
MNNDIKEASPATRPSSLQQTKAFFQQTYHSFHSSGQKTIENISIHYENKLDPSF